MELKDIIFIDNLRKIDLHGFDRETARVETNDFVRENKKLKNARTSTSIKSRIKWL